jgi:hypothetical protein
LSRRGHQTQLSTIEEQNEKTPPNMPHVTLRIDPAISKIQGFKSVSSAHNIIGMDEKKLEVRKPVSLPSRRKKKQSKERRVIICKVEFDCELKPHKPLYFPEFDHKQEFDLSVVTTKDIRDIDSSIKLGVDFITVSYVES